MPRTKASRRRYIAPVCSQQTLVAQFHAYILGCIINAQWNLAIVKDPVRTNIIRRYLTFVHGNDEWAKKDILDAISNKTRKTIKQDTRYVFPSLFVKRKAYPLYVPKELTTDVIFDLEFVTKLQTEIKIIKLQEQAQEKAMDNNEDVAVQPEVTVNTNIVSVESDNPDVPSVQLVLPEGKTVEDLTLENFRAMTGRRFRMTKNQKLVRKLTREQAFEEFKTSLLEEGS